MMRSNRRKHGRLDFAGMRCDLGDVENVSGGGLAVRGRYMGGERLDVTFRDLPDPLTLAVECIWSRRSGRRTYRTGLRFVDPPDDLIERLRGVQLPDSMPRVL